MLWQLGSYKWPDGSLEMAAMGNSTGTGSKLDAGKVRCDVVVMDGVGNWLDMSTEHRDMQEICNGMDMTANTTIHVENI